ncbi:hypothetical protein IAT40_001237 [Kwoniella sp. CBS 6097]
MIGDPIPSTSEDPSTIRTESNRDIAPVIPLVTTATTTETIINVEHFHRLHPVHYIIMDILKRETPIPLLRVDQELFHDLVPNLYKTFTLNEETYKKKMLGAYNVRQRLIGPLNKDVVKEETFKPASPSALAAFRHVRRLEISDVHTAQKLYLDSAADTRTRSIDLEDLFPGAKSIVLGREVMQCVAHPTKVYINIKGLVDCLSTSQAVTSFLLTWPKSSGKLNSPVSYVPYGQQDDDTDTDTDNLETSKDNFDSDCDSDCSCGECNSANDDDESDYITDDESQDDDDSDNDYTEQEYNIGRFIVRRIGMYPALTEIAIRIASKSLMDAIMPLHDLKKQMKIIFIIPREGVAAYEVLSKVWNHHLHCLSVYDFDRVKFKIRYDLTRVKGVREKLSSLVDKEAAGDHLLWKGFKKSLYLPKGSSSTRTRSASPFSSPSPSPSLSRSPSPASSV